MIKGNKVHLQYVNVDKNIFILGQIQVAIKRGNLRSLNFLLSSIYYIKQYKNMTKYKMHDFFPVCDAYVSYCTLVLGFTERV